MQHDLTQGPITQTMLAFAAPMIAGNLLQPCCNIAHPRIVGQFLGAGGQGRGDAAGKSAQNRDADCYFN